MKYVDVNSDLGESFGVYGLGDDTAMLDLVSSANIACGFHAGDPRVMESVVQRATQRGVGIGAHVGFPDLVGFGRRPMRVTPAELRTDVLYQIGALSAFCKGVGSSLQHVKPHGAMFNQALTDRGMAEAIVEAVQAFGHHMILVAIPGTQLARAGQEAGLRVAREGYVDRRFTPEGTLVPRGEEHAVIHEVEEATRQAMDMVTRGTVIAVDGSTVSMEVDTICLHGDTPAAAAMARAVTVRLADAGIELRPLSQHPWPRA